MGVRDLADLHIRAMTSPEATGQRFLAPGEFMWMGDISKTLKSKLGNRAAKKPTRRLPNFGVRMLLPFMPHLRTPAPLLGRRFPFTNQKSRRGLAFSPRPSRYWAESLIGTAAQLTHLWQCQAARRHSTGQNGSSPDASAFPSPFR